MNYFVFFGQFTLHKMNMDECITVSNVIEKLPPSWKDYKHTLKHQKEELTLVQLGSDLRIEKSLRVHESDKTKGKLPVNGQPSVHMVESNNNNKQQESPIDDGFSVSIGDYCCLLFLCDSTIWTKSCLFTVSFPFVLSLS